MFAEASPGPREIRRNAEVNRINLHFAFRIEFLEGGRHEVERLRGTGGRAGPSPSLASSEYERRCVPVEKL